MTTVSPASTFSRVTFPDMGALMMVLESWSWVSSRAAWAWETPNSDASKRAWATSRAVAASSTCCRLTSVESLVQRARHPVVVPLGLQAVGPLLGGLGLGLAEAGLSPGNGGLQLAGIDAEEDFSLGHVIPLFHVQLDDPAHDIGADIDGPPGPDVPAHRDGGHQVPASPPPPCGPATPARSALDDADGRG